MKNIVRRTREWSCVSMKGNPAGVNPAYAEKGVESLIDTVLPQPIPFDQKRFEKWLINPHSIASSTTKQNSNPAFPGCPGHI